MTSTWLGVVLINSAAFGAQFCDVANFPGPYGFQITGRTTISGDSKAVTSLGRIVFDGKRAVGGYSSVMFDGFLLGNPVTGKFETKPDCTISWSLQDDSGGHQHFSGVIGADGKSVRFRQTDPGGGQSGVMARTADKCTDASLGKNYEFSLAGGSVPMSPGDVSRRVDAKGVIQSDDTGKFKLTLKGSAPVAIDVSVRVEPDCIVNLEFSLPSGAGATDKVALRGILVNDGKEILAIRTDPGWMAPARLVVR